MAGHGDCAGAELRERQTSAYPQASAFSHPEPDGGFYPHTDCNVGPDLGSYTDRDVDPAADSHADRNLCATPASHSDGDPAADRDPDSDDRTHRDVDSERGRHTDLDAVELRRVDRQVRLLTLACG